MNVFVVGNGAREHAICVKLAQNPRITKIFAAPGNAGTAAIAENVEVKSDDIPGLIQAITSRLVHLVVIGPETPLARGLAENLLMRGMEVFGPTSAAAHIEASKAFAKDFMHRHGIPAPSSVTFSNYDDALDYLKSSVFPLVIKADGLSQGKGVIIAENIEQARAALDYIMAQKAFGEAGNSVVIEEFLSGREVSAFAFADAHSTSPVVAACDYKRIFDGNKGPNTGGMGSYSPPEFFTPELGKVVSENIMDPVIRHMHDEHRPYKGILYGGLMLTPQGPKVLEFNARFGDPETQVILPRLETDLLSIMQAISNNQLSRLRIDWSQDACVGVVMASGGYPGKYQTGFPVNGLDDVDCDIMVFHAGTSLDDDGRIVTSGGRVVTVVAKASTLEQAREKVYDNIRRISFKDCYYRKDIALIGQA
ncbi:MAG: phosphoribosylamine--glycine ligase [Dehalococcoidaceae bacterium]|nr:phosphoribosylamine--glycine ligase [Dehalococcoidaceae bacterium]